MASPSPIVDLAVWSRFLLGAVLVLWLPGHVGLTRHWRHSAWPVRVAGAVAAGMLLAAAGSRALSAIGVPVQPSVHVPLMVLLGLAAGRVRPLAAALRASDPNARGRWTVLAAGAGALALAVFVVGFADFVAPPHVDDASNHAFLTWRIAQTRSVEPEVLFADPYGRPGLPYLVGMHASAALVAGASGVAPYLAVWLLVPCALVFLPLSLGCLWREWQLPGPALAAATLLAVAGRFAPPGILTWGGFGVVVGMFLTPLVALLLLRCLRSHSIASAALAGLALGTLAHVHASEVALVLVVVAVTWALEPTRPRCTWLGIVTLAATALVALGPSTLSASADAYATHGMAAMDQVHTPAGSLAERYLKSGGTQPHLVALWIVALILAARNRRSRPIAIASLVVAAVALALGAVGDPVSRALSTPFYREPWRLQYVQLFFAPALMGWAAARGLELVHRRVASPLVPAALALAFALPPQIDVVRLYRETWKVVPFTRADYYHALRMRSEVPAGAWIVNDPHDGSTWAAFVSGCHFLRPAAWDLRDSSDTWMSERIAGIGEDPWPERFQRLRDRGVLYVYASDTRVGDTVFDRTLLDEDPRFGRVLDGETSTLYGIRW